MAVHLLGTSRCRAQHMGAPALAAEHFVWLVLSIPLNGAMLTSEEGFPEAELERYADEAVQVFLAAYGQG